MQPSHHVTITRASNRWCDALVINPKEPTVMWISKAQGTPEDGELEDMPPVVICDLQFYEER